MIKVNKLDFFTDGWTIVNDELVDVELMQFTELFDIKEVEIYEGDICEVFFATTVGRTDIQIPRISEIIFNNQFSAFVLKNINYKLIGDENIRLKVIGNIYQNPELLTKA